MSANGGPEEGKLKITCPACKQVFSVPLPPPEISNNFRCSVVSVAHDRLIRCINTKCAQPFVMIVQGAQLMMNVQPVGDEVVAQLEGSRIIKPQIGLVQN